MRRQPQEALHRHFLVNTPQGARDLSATPKMSHFLQYATFFP